MPNPNEVMDVEKKYNKFEKVLRLTLSNNCYNPNETDHCWGTDLCRFCEAEYKEIMTSHTALVAQQNAALLRELDTHRIEALIGARTVEVIPASILEAKLNEITKEVI